MLPVDTTFETVSEEEILNALRGTVVVSGSFLGVLHYRGRDRQRQPIDVLKDTTGGYSKVSIAAQRKKASYYGGRFSKSNLPDLRTRCSCRDFQDGTHPVKQVREGHRITMPFSFFDKNLNQ